MFFESKKHCLAKLFLLTFCVRDSVNLRAYGAGGLLVLAAPLSFRSIEHERSLCFTLFSTSRFLVYLARGCFRIYSIYFLSVFLRLLSMQSCLKHSEL